jgi:cytochrome c biogenesis protein CcdA
VSFLVWLPTFALHSVAHARTSTRLTRDELARRAPATPRGQRARLALDAASLVLGAVGVAVLLAPTAAYAGTFTPEGQAFAGPWVAGIALTLLVVALAWRTRGFRAALRADASDLTSSPPRR